MHTHFINNKSKRDGLINFQWFLHFISNKCFHTQVCTSNHPSFSIQVSGSEGSVVISFWLFLQFYFIFDQIFPEWVYPMEFNQFAMTTGTIEKNKTLTGKDRCRETGWIRTAKRETSLRFHDYAMWWDIWNDSDSWSSDIPKWRSGNFSFQDTVRGKETVTTEVMKTYKETFEMPEGIYLSTVTITEYTRTYSRWFTNKFRRFNFEFGFNDNEGEWVQTPVVHWGKGTMSYNCGMDGTYSCSLSSEVKTKEEAKIRMQSSLIKDRKRYGKIDCENMNDPELGHISENLINKITQ